MAFRLVCRKQGPGGDYCVTVRGDKLFLALPDDSDPYQLWSKENDGSYGFMLINKATNKVISHIRSQQLYLVDKPSYNNVPGYVVWTESIGFGCGYNGFMPLGFSTNAMDAQDVFDGAFVSIYRCTDQYHIKESAQWKLVPAPAPAPAPVYTQPSNMIYCLARDAQYCIAIKAGNIVLASPNPNDPTQQWYKDDTQSNQAGSFMLVNKSNFQAAKQSSADQPLKLANRPNTPDNSFMWTESETDGYGFTYLVTATNTGLAMDARSRDGKETHDDKYLSFSKNLKGDNQKWKFIS
ncbi:ricin B-like lectin R40G2 isoform X2 [Silene latifolia]|uniref:ricin B-like lectin R40G2 isoform X2 n=1 Tax=Silene latifolia TaxID=37657 RepID=UPI003D77942C